MPKSGAASNGWSIAANESVDNGFCGAIDGSVSGLGSSLFLFFKKTAKPTNAPIVNNDEINTMPRVELKNSPISSNADFCCAAACLACSSACC